MGKLNKQHQDRERFGKCEICLENIPIEFISVSVIRLFAIECGTEYVLKSKTPVKLAITEGNYDPDDYFGEMIFDD